MPQLIAVFVRAHRWRSSLIWTFHVAPFIHMTALLLSGWLHSHCVRTASTVPAWPNAPGFQYHPAAARRRSGASFSHWLAFRLLSSSFLLFLSTTFCQPFGCESCFLFSHVIQCFSVLASIWQDDFIFFLCRHFDRNELWLHHVNGGAFPIFSFSFFHFQPCLTCRYRWRRSQREAEVICFRN